ncbi:MAG TPA: hypothetical protein PLP21_10040 [Pyrinomonadaceae bacterium]|nr:hypothetical protein [Acidobacteriota bacterium]HQZ96649.1 hypothetical protein [Pyrinomonadaceae bacterium]
MLKDAVNYYNELLTDSDLATSSQKLLDEGLESSKLIFGGRRLSPYLRPHFVMESDWTMIKSTCEVVFGALQKVKDAAIGDDAILDQLGVTEIERGLIKIDPGYSHVSPTSRLDSFLTDEAYSYVELNGESPAGIAFADSATKIFESLPVMRKFSERYSLQGLEGRSKLLNVLVDCFTEFIGGKKPERAPTIAIVDLDDLPTIKEFELFKEYFESNGYPAIICSPSELEFKNERLSCNGTPIDIVYKRLLVNEYLPIMEAQPDLLNAYRAGTVCMVNSFRGKLVHKKAIFAVLTNERYKYLFNAEELSAIDKHIPWTRKFVAEKTENKGESIDLVEWTRSNSHKLVLKPNDDYGGNGIYIGWNSTETEWDDAIAIALKDGDYLVQERVKTAKETFPMFIDDEGNWEMTEQLVDLDPLLFMGKVGAAFTRLSSTELANVSSGGGMVPTFIISDK